MTGAATACLPVWLAGAGGLLAGEFLRLLETHPALDLEGAWSRAGGGDLARTQPHLGRGEVVGGLEEAPADLARGLERHAEGVLVFALPHGRSSRLWPAWKKDLGPAAERLRVIDLAADFRLRDPLLYREAYGEEHPAPAELARFRYGLPEHNRARLCGARRVAAAGCFATALQLAVLPPAAAGILDADRPWIFSGVTGSSGSGRRPSPITHHPHRHGNFWAYALEGHRHEAELRQALAPVGIAPEIHFLPHSGPFVRGIHLSAFLPLAPGAGADAVRACYRGACAGEPFVELLEEGVPDLHRVAGSNRACLATGVRGGVLTVLLALDNLLKGGAGQALQCLNLMLELPETTGLPRSGLGT